MDQLDKVSHLVLKMYCHQMFIADFYSPDPILTAFRLSRELQKRAKAEDEFKDAYMQLAGTIQTLTK